MLPNAKAPTRHLLLAGLVALSALILSSPRAFAAMAVRNPIAHFKTAGGGEVIINADTTERDTERQIIELKGHVQMVYDEQHISADHIQISLATQELVATGNIIMNSPTIHLEADSMKLNYQQQTGIIYNGFIRSGQIYLEGKEIKKIGPDEYEATQGYFSACDTCPPAWNFEGKKIHAKIGEYGTIRQGWLDIARVPIIPLPYLIFPLKTQRQTGLLLPSLSKEGTGGFTFSESLFWAMSRSQDALFTYKHYEMRGDYGAARYRYVLNPTSDGEFSFEGLNDRRFPYDPEIYQSASNSHPSSRARYNVSYGNYHEMPDGFTQYSKIDQVSDLHYPRDFIDQVIVSRGGKTSVYGEPAIESRVYLARTTESQYASVDAAYYTNLLKTDPLANNNDSIQRLPELRYSIANTEIAGTGLLFKFDSDYVNFARSDLGYDNICSVPNPYGAGTVKAVCPNRTGYYNPQPGTTGPDLVRTGSRLMIAPEISYPFRIGTVVDAVPKLQVTHTQYFLNTSPGSTDQTPTANHVDGDGAAPSRDEIRGSIALRTRYSRIYIPHPEDVKADRYKHEIEPEISFSGAYVRQTNSIFLGKADHTPPFMDTQPISDADIQNQNGRGIQFDYYDRLTDRQLLTMGVTNKLIRREWANGEPTYVEVARWRLSQSYDFDQISQNPGYPFSDLSNEITLKWKKIQSNTVIRYFPYHGVANTTSTVSLFDERGDSVGLGLVQQYLISENLKEAYPKRSEDMAFGAKLVSKYVNLEGQVDLLPIHWDHKYQVKSWRLFPSFTPPGKCWGLKLELQQQLGNAAVYKLNFQYNFGA